MKEEISLDIAMSKEEMAKIKELLTSSPGLRHYAFELKTGEYLDLVEYKDYEKLEEENKSLQSQLKAKEEMVKVMEKYFELIIDLGFDYDGLSQVDSLKWLIDELVHYAKLGRVCNTTEAIYEIENKKFNILHKEILSKGENK